MSMTIREALEVFGVDMVRAAVQSFDHPSCGNWGTCFIGCAFMGLASQKNCSRVIARIHAWQDAGADDAEQTRRYTAVHVLSNSYENIIDDEYDPRIPTRDEMRAEVMAFLAEHGSHPEPAVFVEASAQ